MSRRLASGQTQSMPQELPAVTANLPFDELIVPGTGVVSHGDIGQKLPFPGFW
jgi:hypothetical protein